MDKVDILYLAKGRLEFTKHTLGMLVKNTNWELVNKLVVYDDGSSKPDRTWLHRATTKLKMKNEFRTTDFGSPVAVMLDFLDRHEADVFAKIDNDIVLPPGWLEAMTSVMDAEPVLDLLGMEAGMSGRPDDDWDGVYGVNRDCSHIGGVGLMRTRAFRRASRPVPNGRYGFTEYQHKFYPPRAWIKPDLKMCELDKLPFDPWMSLSERYIEDGVQRRWGKQPADMFDHYWSWWNEDLRLVRGTGIEKKNPSTRSTK
jgi:glycosyltransferase involved in cell wall biosynthesis